MDMTKDKGHLNGIARSIGIRPECREMATDEELAFAAEWMRLRVAAFREQQEHLRYTTPDPHGGHGD